MCVCACVGDGVEVGGGLRITGDEEGVSALTVLLLHSSDVLEIYTLDASSASCSIDPY